LALCLRGLSVVVMLVEQFCVRKPLDLLFCADAFVNQQPFER
jgi:hypothetical protein